MQNKEEKQKEKAVSKQINPDCPCDENCVRHGKCFECQEYHKTRECGKTSCGK